MATEQFANKPVTTLNGAIDGDDTSLVVGSASLFPTVPQFRILVESEYMLVTGVTGTTFTVTRGVEGSSNVSHANGVPVTHILTAGALGELRSAAGLKTTTTVVDVESSSAPSSGQVLTATSSTAATWQGLPIVSETAAGCLEAGWGYSSAYDVACAAASGAVTVLSFPTGLTADGMSRVVGVELEVWAVATGVGGIATWGAVELTRAGGVVSIASGSTAERTTLASLGVPALVISGTDLLVTFDTTEDARANTRVLPIGAARTRSLTAL